VHLVLLDKRTQSRAPPDFGLIIFKVLSTQKHVKILSQRYRNFSKDFARFFHREKFLCNICR
jgi:hypothetical protein